LAKLKVVRIVGLNFRDKTQDAVAWLERWGDPYDVNLADRDGRISIDFGVYAAPETFLVDPSGTIVYKHIGPLTRDLIETEILPLVADMEADG
jgi:cytochrome c biogenesis protein CcmG/thiol:disulfide interchange protein DsbE